LGSLGALASTIGGVMYMHFFAEGGTLLSLGLGMILYTMFVWWRDVICESTYEVLGLASPHNVFPCVLKI